MIFSGGQTGVDRAAWDAAIALGIPHGGWVPKGRLAEDGPIARTYSCKETDSPEYAVRTEKNIVSTDVTLVLSFGKPTGGTQLTLALCRKHGKPNIAVDLLELDNEDAVERFLSFLQRQQPKNMNIAGPRGSSREDAYSRAFTVLRLLFDRWLAWQETYAQKV